MKARDKTRATQLRRINAVDFEGEALRRGYVRSRHDSVYVPRDKMIAAIEQLRGAILRYAQYGSDSVRVMGEVMLKLDTQVGCHDIRTGHDSEAAK